MPYVDLLPVVHTLRNRYHGLIIIVMKRGVWPLTAIVFVKDMSGGEEQDWGKAKEKERECNKNGAKIRLEMPLYRGSWLLKRERKSAF